METKTDKTKNRCQCLAHFDGETYEEIVDNATGETEDTGVPVYKSCGATTDRIYAPGHDAKLKGALIKRYLADEPFIQLDGGMLIHGDPMEVARQLGWDHFLVAAYARRADKAEAKRERAAAKIAARQAVQAGQVKIGRWTYDIVKILGEFTDEVEVEYRTKQGDLKTAMVKTEALVA